MPKRRGEGTVSDFDKYIQFSKEGLRDEVRRESKNAGGLSLHKDR